MYLLISVDKNTKLDTYIIFITRLGILIIFVVSIRFLWTSAAQQIRATRHLDIIC